MNRHTLPILLGLLFLCATVAAQPNEANKTVPPKEIAGKSGKEKTASDLEAERILRERRAQAQSLLISLAADAGSYSDQKLRARAARQRNDMTIRRALLVVLLCSIPLSCQSRPAPSRTELAPGIFLFMTPGYGDVGLDGNSIAVLSRDGVLVFDANGTPAASAAVLADIRAMTDQPVRWIVYSHWHWDHWYGTETYQRAFPDVRIVAHEKTREMMMGPALE